MIRTVDVRVNQKPVIQLLGEPQVSLIQGQDYIEAGAIATDVEDGDNE